MLNTFLPDYNDANHVVFSSLDIILTLITMHGKTDVTDVLKVAKQQVDRHKLALNSGSNKLETDNQPRHCAAHANN